MGLPAALLERRPDVQAAEQLLVAANARVGAAKALFFPRISLTGLYGSVSGDFSDLMSNDAEVWSVPCIKPLSRQQLADVVTRVDGLVTLEEHSVMGGLGSCIAEETAAIRPLPICRIGVQDRFSAYCGTWDYLLKEHQIDLSSVQKRVEEFVNHLPARSSAAIGTS